jgi:NTE family protein
MDAEARGLALAAGGARGAFQAGALLCFAERRIAFAAVAGASIGAVNGAFLAQGDGSAGHAERLCAVWRTLPAAGLLRPNPRALSPVLALLASAAGGSAAALVARLAFGSVALLDPAPLARVLDRHLDYASICRAATRVTVALLPAVSPLYDVVTGPWRRATHLDAHHLDAGQLRAALLAAVAIPVAFPSRTVLSRKHADGGIADPVPVRALHDRGVRRIVAVALSTTTFQDRAELPGATLLQVRPPASEVSSLPSIFDFSRSTIERLIDHGYRQARVALDEVQELADGLTALHRAGAANQSMADALPVRRRRRWEEKDL